MSYKRLWMWVCFVLLSVALGPRITFAMGESGQIRPDPSILTITGTLGGGPLAGSLRLLPDETLGDVTLVPTDLADATRNGGMRDPIPASAVTLLPATEFMTLTAGSLTQVLVQVAPPTVAGTYTGTLLIHWTRPQPGQRAVPLTVVARTRPVLAFQGADQLPASGRRGKVITRHITLQETTPQGTPLTGLRALPQDLLTTDGKVLAANRIRVALPSDAITGGQPVTASVTLDLRNLAPGAYSGEVLFVSDIGTPLALPVAVNVRYGWVWPAVVAGIGVGLGLYLATYQHKGKARDGLTLRIVAVREALGAEDGPQAGFHSRIALWLSKAEAAVRAEEWDVAETAVENAEGLLRKWYAGNWQAQIDYLQRVQTELEATKEETGAFTGLKVLEQQVQAALEKAPDLDTPAALRQKALDIERALARIAGIWQQYQAVEKIRAEAAWMDYETQEAWRLELQRLQNEIYRLSPDEEEAWTQIEQDLQALGKNMLQAIESAQQMELGAEAYTIPKDGALGHRGMEATGRGTLDQLKALLLAPIRALQAPPEAGPFTLEDASRARRKQRLYTLVTYAVGGLALAAVGYNTLYMANPTFGAQPISDYIALLAWGLGAETTFANVAGMLSQWDIPFGKQG
jgi:hypothetical protein